MDKSELSQLTIAQLEELSESLFEARRQVKDWRILDGLLKNITSQWNAVEAEITTKKSYLAAQLKLDKELDEAFHLDEYLDEINAMP